MLSIFQVRIFSQVLAFAILSGMIQSASAVPADSCGSLDRLKVALTFAQVMYPDLKDKEFTVSLSHGNGPFINSPIQADDMRIGLDIENEDMWHPPGETANQYYRDQIEPMQGSGIELPLYLYFSFIDLRGTLEPRRRHLTCKPLEFRSNASEKKLRDVAKIIEPHPEWSDAQELEEARKLGLRYGPEDKDSVLPLIPLNEMSQFYGPLKIKSAEFLMNGGQKCSGCSFVLPRWEVKVSATHGVGWLSITVEPFFGRITSLSSGQ